MKVISAVLISILIWSPLVWAAQTLQISFEVAEKLASSPADKAAIERQIGLPNRKQSFGVSGAEEVWYYDEGTPGQARLSLSFQAGRLLSVNWFVRKADPEAQFSWIQSRYPSAHFSMIREEQTNPHQVPYRSQYYDPALRLSIEVRQKTNEVQLISWETAESSFEK